MKNEVYQQKIDLVKFQIITLLLSVLSLLVWVFFIFYFLPPFVLQYFYKNNQELMQSSNFFFHLNNGILAICILYLFIFFFLLVKRKKELNFWLNKQREHLIETQDHEEELLRQIEDKINQIVTKKQKDEK